jgi:hypothetical protein
MEKIERTLEKLGKIQRMFASITHAGYATITSAYPDKAGAVIEFIRHPGLEIQGSTFKIKEEKQNIIR